MSRAPDSRFQCQKTIGAFFRKLDAIEIFGLQAERRHRSSKFVCRIRNEPALLIEHRSDAFEKPIDRGDERQQFRWHSFGRKLCQMIRLLRVELRGEQRHRPKAVANDNTHQQNETRDEDRKQ